jgi:hypothetical protein
MTELNCAEHFLGIRSKRVKCPLCQGSLPAKYTVCDACAPHLGDVDPIRITSWDRMRMLRVSHA